MLQKVAFKIVLLYVYAARLGQFFSSCIQTLLSQTQRILGLKPEAKFLVSDLGDKVDCVIGLL
jgi:hypothetical protein